MNMIRHNNIAAKIIIGVFPMPNRPTTISAISGCLR